LVLGDTGSTGTDWLRRCGLDGEHVHADSWEAGLEQLRRLALDAILAINAILEETSRGSVTCDVKRHDGRVVKRVFEPVQIRQVELDDAMADFGGDIELDLASKFSIEPGFIRGLMDVGLEQARRTSAKLMTKEHEEAGSA